MTYVQPPPPPPPSANTPQRKRPWWKALWFVALVALIIGLAIGASAAGGDTSSAAKPGPTVTATATATVAATVTATPTIMKTIATRTHTIRVIYTPPPKPAVNDGTYRVGTDIRPGQFRTDGQGDGVGCYWERERNLSGSIDSIIANDNIDGPTIIEVNRGEYLKLSGGCDWRHE